MQVSDASQTLLAHFDRRETAPQYEIQCVESSRRVRSIGWVLKWAGVWGMLLVSAGFLIEFGYRLAAEQALARAARAGLLEATLPHATAYSVQQTVDLRLTGLSFSPGELLVALQQNGAPVRGPLRLRDGDQLSLLLTAPSRAALPHWLSATFFRNGEDRMQTLVERKLPDRRLREPARDAG